MPTNMRHAAATPCVVGPLSRFRGRKIFVGAICVSAHLALASSALDQGLQTGGAITPFDGIYNDHFENPANLFFSGSSQTLSGRLYRPGSVNSTTPIVILMHGCLGMWSNKQPWPDADNAVAQSAIERWGLKVSEYGYIALAIDSFTVRTPQGVAGVTPETYQDQCNGDPTTHMLPSGVTGVDPYTTRVADIDAGIGWLRATFGLPASSPVGLIGWSEGGEAVLVRAAETARLMNPDGTEQDLYASPTDQSGAIQATVTFYPGCGHALGFNMTNPIVQSDWRPHFDARINMGLSDTTTPTFVQDCQDRVQTAVSQYHAISGSGHWADFETYPGAIHSFDGTTDSQWPQFECNNTYQPSADECAERKADIESLNFITSRL